MIKKTAFILALTSLITGSAGDVAGIAKKALTQIPVGSAVLQGSNGFLYSANELRHLSKGDLANGKIKDVSAATNAKNANPIPAISAFNNDLKKLGIKLIVVPIPPKMAIYPIGGLNPGDAAKFLKPFYAELREHGIDVLDLTDVFIKNREKAIFCRTDSHWSSDGITIAAEELAKKISYRGNKVFTVTENKITVAGDLQKLLAPQSSPSEKITLPTVAGNVLSSSSPILVLGDSHTLFFSTGSDMLAENSGFTEQLAVKLQSDIDRIAIKGSAATAVRINLYRKSNRDKKYLSNKKVVIWIFSCREFTEAVSGFAQIPVSRNR